MDTDQDTAKRFDNNQMDTSDGELDSENCQKAIKYLNETCFMDFGEEFSVIEARCVIGGEAAWQICMASAVELTDNCADAIEAAEGCDIHL